MYSPPLRGIVPPRIPQTNGLAQPIVKTEMMTVMMRLAPG